MYAWRDLCLPFLILESFDEPMRGFGLFWSFYWLLPLFGLYSNRYFGDLQISINLGNWMDLVSTMNFNELGRYKEYIVVEIRISN